MDPVRTARRSMRIVFSLVAICVMMAIVGGLTAAVGLAVAPHGASVLGAVETTRESRTLVLEEGAERSKMYDAYGGLMTILRDAEDREWLPYDSIPDTVIEGVLAVEDADFWEHSGVDWLSTIRAASENVAAGTITQGGSTITQQIVKLSFVGAEQSLERKIREAMLATDLEKLYSKEEILEYYLNTIYFGNSAYGVQAAAEIYFGKDASQLTYGDVALLAGFIRSPGVYTFSDPDIDFARQRRSRSIARFLALDLVDDDEAALIEEEPIPTFSRSEQEESLRRDYFAEYVVQALLDMPELGDTPDARKAAVFQGGLKIETTYDPVLERYARESIAEIFGTERGPEPFAVSLASVDPSTGAIRAMLGGNNFSEDQFNLATQGWRQPGSSFKSYVLATAMEQGIGASDVINGQGPCIFDDGAKPYEVNNFGGGKGSIDTLAAQTSRSSNCAYVRLGIFVGLDNVVDMTTKMIGEDILGIDHQLRPFPSMSLGAQELTPLAQAVGYSVFANDGVRMEPHAITKIIDRNGEVIFDRTLPTGRQVISERTARGVTSVLEANVRGGTGTRARLASGQPAAGKTGTAQNFEDAWFVGYTPQLSTAVWMGHPEEKIPMQGVGGINVTGGSYPARVWNAFMTRALAESPVQDFNSGPSFGGNELIFLPDEKCTIRVQVGEIIQSFTIPCSEVVVSGGTYGFGSGTICRGVTVVDEEGNESIVDAPCVDLPEILNPTTTTTLPEDVIDSKDEPPVDPDNPGDPGDPGDPGTSPPIAPPVAPPSSSPPATTTTAPPTTAPPTTAPPTTAPPTTAPPTTAPPTTAPPTTAPPTTAPPTTDPPADPPPP